MKAGIVERIFTLYTISKYSEQLIEFMLSFPNRLANIAELADKIQDLNYKGFIDAGFIFNGAANKDLNPTDEQILFGRIFANVDFKRVATSIYEKLYNTSMLRRLVDTNTANSDLARRLQDIFLVHEDDFFNDKNLEIIFEFLTKYC